MSRWSLSPIPGANQADPTGPRPPQLHTQSHSPIVEKSLGVSRRSRTTDSQRARPLHAQ